MTIDEFSKAELRIAKIKEAERVEGSDKLIKLKVSLGEEDRQILAGIGKAYDPDALTGKEIVIVANLDPRMFTLRQSSGQVDIESQGMLLAATDSDGKPALLVPEREVDPGTKIK